MGGEWDLAVMRWGVMVGLPLDQRLRDVLKKEKPDLMDWLGFSRELDFSKARLLGGLVSVVLVFVILFVLVVFGMTAFEFFKAVADIDQFKDQEAQSAAIRNSGLALAAMIGVPFLVWRSVVAQKQVDVAEQGQITDRITKAVQGLGADKSVRRQRLRKTGKLAYVNVEGKPDFSQPIMEEVTAPNLEVRIGSIYALERIAQDSGRDHIQIMEILCAYIRQNAPVRPTDKSPMELWAEADRGRKPSKQDEKKWSETLPKPRIDIQVSLQVIGRRSDRQIRLERATDNQEGVVMYRLNLSHCCLQAADMRFLNFNRADFSGAQLQAVMLYRAQMQNSGLNGAHLGAANLNEAQVQNADFSNANLQGTSGIKAKMQGARLIQTQMQGVRLGGAQMQQVHLNWAQIQGADLRGAQMQGADIRWGSSDSSTKFEGVVIRGAAIRGASYRDLGFSQSQVDELFYDGSVNFAPDIARAPDRGEELIQPEFESRWRAWQKSIG